MVKVIVELMFKDANGGSPDIDFMERYIYSSKLFAIYLAYIYINKSNACYCRWLQILEFMGLA
jgi:hypothetical protein